MAFSGTAQLFSGNFLNSCFWKCLTICIMDHLQIWNEISLSSKSVVFIRSLSMHICRYKVLITINYKILKIPIKEHIFIREYAKINYQINQKCPFADWTIPDITCSLIFFWDFKISRFSSKSPGFLNKRLPPRGLSCKKGLKESLLLRNLKWFNPSFAIY